MMSEPSRRSSRSTRFQQNFYAADADVKAAIEGDAEAKPMAKPMYPYYARHWEYHCQGNPKYSEEEERCHWCQLRAFSTYKDYPIQIINTVDDVEIPRNFRFIENSVLREGVARADEEFRTGCNCQDDRQCQKLGCECLEDMAVPEGTQVGKKIYVYHTVGERAECLRGKVLESREPIYECHAGCACSKSCPNRVVERGRCFPLQIFRTDDGRGWGVRSILFIRKGEYVDKYVGEVITSEEANIRRDESQVAQRKDVYLFALDKFSDKNSQDPRLAGPPLEVDGEFASGPTRFINHSCEPNLRIFARVGDHADKHLHDLAFFALRDIPAMEELTFDYVDGEVTELKEDAKNPKKKMDMTRCLCGTDSCRGYLW